MACPDNPSPTPSCGCTPCDGASPFDAATGAAEQSFSFLQTNYGSFNINWYNLYELNGNPDDPNRGLGPNWSSPQFGEGIEHAGGDNVSLMFSPGRSGICNGGGVRTGGGGSSNGGGSIGVPQGPIATIARRGVGRTGTFWFRKTQSNPVRYAACYGCDSTMGPTKRDREENWRLVEPDGTISYFDMNTGLISFQDTPGYQTTEFILSTTTTENRIGEIKRTYEYGTNEETIESRYFEYTDDNVQYITLRRATDSTNPNWTNIRRLELVYYTTDEEGKGNVGDLKLVKEQLPGPTAGSWIDDKVTLFRYYTINDNNGFQHALKYVLSPEGYERMTDPEGSSNAVLAPYASVYYEYDSNRRVSKVAVNGGQVEDTVSYTENTPSTYTFDNWVRKAVITMPDGLVKTVYSNHVGQDLLIDDKDDDDHWITYNKYNSDGRREELVHPSAIDMSGTPYNDANDNLDVQIKSNDGLIEVFTYYTTTDPATGKAKGYPEFRKVKKGSGGTEIDIEKRQYTQREVLVQDEPDTTIYPVSKSTVYRSDTLTGDPVDTEFEYTWFDQPVETIQAKTIKTKLPVVPADENGVNAPQQDEILDTFDIQGRLVESKDARGTITKYEYDEVTGAITEMIQDAGTGGLQLTTTITVDDLGRPTESLGPAHDINGQNVQTAKWTVYQDSDNEVWKGNGYKTGSTYWLVNPVSIETYDKDGRPVDEIQATRGSGVEDQGKLTESDSFPQSSWVRWTHSIYGNGGRLTAARVYHTIPSSGEGTSGTNFDETTFGFDSMGRQNKTKTPGGTITRQVFDVRGNVDSVWIGTNDTGATDSDPSGGGAFQNNMNTVAQNQYDDGQDGGDGNLTKVTQPVDDTLSNDRITEYVHDWRDRLITKITNDGTYDFHDVYTLDNLGRTTVTETKRDDTSSLVLIAKDETEFDTRGRVYRTITYAVDDSGVVGNSLKSNDWFDADDNILKSKPSGSEAFTKFTYDAIGRQTNSYYGYYDGTGTDNPELLTDNVIFAESETQYDDANNLTFSITKQRFHNATGTGALNVSAFRTAC